MSSSSPGYEGRQSMSSRVSSLDAGCIHSDQASDPAQVAGCRVGRDRFDGQAQPGPDELGDVPQAYSRLADTGAGPSQRGADSSADRNSAAASCRWTAGHVASRRRGTRTLPSAGLRRSTPQQIRAAPGRARTARAGSPIRGHRARTARGRSARSHRAAAASGRSRSEPVRPAVRTSVPPVTTRDRSGLSRTSVQSFQNPVNRRYQLLERLVNKS
jgi:hypothetical protein